MSLIRAGLSFTLYALRIGYCAANGWRRRRDHWHADSWPRFALTQGLWLLVAVVPAIPAVDRPRLGEPASTLRSVWQLTLLACIFVGALGFTVTLGWFAGGAAEQPFSARLVARRFFARVTGAT